MMADSMTLPKQAHKGGAPRGPRSAPVIQALELIRQWRAEGRPLWERGTAPRGSIGLIAEAAREVGLAPQQVQAAWRKYGGDTESEEHRAYDAGRDARRHGAKAGNNPYMAAHMRDAWDRGWGS